MNTVRSSEPRSHRHTGAEVKTEGDSFYVVFGSARRAAACGLAIVEAAEQFGRDHPDRPIRVGDRNQRWRRSSEERASSEPRST